MPPTAFFHTDSGAVRFWVDVADIPVGASISLATLHHRYRPEAHGENPMDTFTAHRAELEAVVRRRVGEGAIEPVMLREHDLKLVSASLLARPSSTQ